VRRCSATVVGKHNADWIAVSAGHCFLETGNRAVARLGVNGTWLVARLVSFSVTASEDLAVLELEYPGELPAAPLFEHGRVEAGDRVLVRAFAYGTSYREREAAFRSADRNWIKVSGLPLEGESGGGVFAGNQLLAVIKGHPAFGEISTIGTNSRRIRQFLLGALGDLPAVPGEGEERKSESEKPPDQPPSAELPAASEPPAGGDNPILNIPNAETAGELAHVTDRMDRLARAVDVAIATARLAGYVGLGGSGLGGVALLLPALGVFRRWRRNRRLFRESAIGEKQPARRDPDDAGETPKSADAPLPRILDETRQLLQLRQQENRMAPLDALRGVLVDDELDHDIQGNDESRAAWAQDMKRRLDERVNEIAPLSVKA